MEAQTPAAFAAQKTDNPNFASRMESTGEVFEVTKAAPVASTAQHTPNLTPLEQQLATALRRLTREYIFHRTMDGTSAEDCETMECVCAARSALAKATGAAA